MLNSYIQSSSPGPSSLSVPDRLHGLFRVHAHLLDEVRRADGRRAAARKFKFYTENCLVGYKLYIPDSGHAVDEATRVALPKLSYELACVLKASGLPPFNSVIFVYDRFCLSCR